MSPIDRKHWCVWMLSHEERLRKVLDRKRSQSGIQKCPEMKQKWICKIASIGIMRICLAHSVAKKKKKSTPNLALQRTLTLFNILWSEWETYCICYLISEWECFSLRILRRESFFDNWTPCGGGQVETVPRGFKEDSSENRTEAFPAVMRRGISLTF